MPYELRAVIAAVDLAKVVAAEVPLASVVELAQGLALIPMTDELFRVVNDPERPSLPGFGHFPGGFALRLGAWSQAGPIAYVEAEYCDGMGSQQAALWLDGKIDFGPIGTGGVVPVPRRSGPISQVLQRLGAQKADGTDEFDSVGLLRHRQLTEWLPL
ncbi:hypothetical protein ABT095_36200 [Kitasatospora sp. NPDC002227]|uniref:hypothetical protein n=1 Tax=Kitasatospora sp. NPDC002227 TaxID=3154773 RepID=UPI00331CBF6F